MEKNVEISLLFDFYRNMLTDRQAESIDLFIPVGDWRAYGHYPPGRQG